MYNVEQIQNVNIKKIRAKCHDSHRHVHLLCHLSEMDRMDTILDLIKGKRESVIQDRTDFLIKLEKVKPLLMQDEEYWEEIINYVTFKQNHYDSFLTELEELEFKIEEEKIKNEESKSDTEMNYKGVKIKDNPQVIEQIYESVLKKFKVIKCFYWE